MNGYLEMANVPERNKRSQTRHQLADFSLSAYEYLDRAPLIGWAWEFWRRGPLSGLSQNRTFAIEQNLFPNLPYEPITTEESPGVLIVKQPDKSMTWEEVVNQRCDPRHLLWTPLVVQLAAEGKNEFGLNVLPTPRIELSVCLAGNTRQILAQTKDRVERAKAKLKMAVINEPRKTWKKALVVWDQKERLRDYKDAGGVYLSTACPDGFPDTKPNEFALEQCRVVRPFIDHHEWLRFACFRK